MFSENLKKIRNEARLSQKALADMLFVSQQTVAKWEMGSTTPNPDTVVKIAEIFKTSTDALLGRVDSNVEFIKVPRSTAKIPVLGCIPAGVPVEAVQDIIDYIEVSEELLRGGKEFFALKIKGNSMYPEYLPEDIVIFERCSTCDTGDDCAVMINGDDATFKRIERKDSGIMVKPLNPDYETMFFTNQEIEEKPVRILGIARELRRRK